MVLFNPSRETMAKNLVILHIQTYSKVDNNSRGVIIVMIMTNQKSFAAESIKQMNIYRENSLS